jgi:CheY-like chemotaxis protein
MMGVFVMQGDPAARRSAAKGLSRREYHRRRRILVVDDEPDIIELLSKIFDNLGCEVSRAGDGREAFEMFRRES